MQIQPLLTHATAQLQVSSESARADAEILLAHCLQKSRTYLFTWPEKELEPAVEAQFKQLLALRCNGVPVAYLTGYREFWTLNLRVTAATLIPRPETELLVEAALAKIPTNASCDVLDLGTGTGAIALAIASERPLAKIIAVDASTAALAIAAENVQTHGLSNVMLQHSDWFTALSAQRFHLIVSNPPYIEQQDPHLQQGDVRFEPLTALASGEDGLEDIRHIVAHAPARLHAGGWLLLEHGYNQGQAVTNLLQQRGFQQVHCLPDLAGNDRISLGQWLG